MNVYDARTQAALDDWKPRLALVALGIFAAAIVFACVWGDAATQTTMFGGSLVMASNALNYFFQSSAASARKDQTIADANQALAVSTPPQQAQ